MLLYYLVYCLRKHSWLVLYIPQAKDLVSGNETIEEIARFLLRSHLHSSEPLLKEIPVKDTGHMKGRTLHDLLIEPFITSPGSDCPTYVETFNAYINELKIVTTYIHTLKWNCKPSDSYVGKQMVPHQFLFL